MSANFRERLKDTMLAQQMATQQNLLQRYTNSAGIRLPPILAQNVMMAKTAANKVQQPNRSRRDSAVSNHMQVMDPLSGRIPYNHMVMVNDGSNGLTSPMFLNGAGQLYNPWGRNYYYGKMTIPAAFPMSIPAVEVEPLHVPKERSVRIVKEEQQDIDWDGPDDSWWKKERVAIKLRHMFYVSWYLALMKASAASKGKIHEMQHVTDESVLFEILIKEIIYAIHRIYLDRNSELRRLMMQIIKTNDLTVCLREAQEGAPFSPALEEVVYLLENIIYQITYIQPITGVLGTNYRSFLISLIKDGQLFPLGEFWDMEKRWLKFDYTGRTINSGQEQAALLLKMVFIARGLVWTLLLHPEDYNLAKAEPGLSPISRRNLKLMATLFLFIYRRVIIPRDTYRIPPAPKEIAHFLLTDEEIKPLVERIENSLLYCDGLIREWASAYVRRLKQVEKK